MDQTKKQREKIIHLNTFARRRSWLQDSSKGSNGYGDRNQEFDYIGSYLNNFKSGQSKGKGVTNGESCHQNHDLSPISGYKNSTKRQDK